MKKSEWSDSEIEELLRQMPKIQDLRDPRDIYQNLSSKKRKLYSWILPSLAAVAAILLFTILVPKLIDGPSPLTFERSADKNISEEMQSTKKDSNSTGESSDLIGNELDKSSTELLKSAVYEEDIENGKVFTYWIPDEQIQNLIPISMIVPEGKKSWLDLFNEQMKLLNEEQWGLTDYYPLDAQFTLDEKNNVLDVDVPADHQYGQGSANETLFLNLLKRDIASNSNLKTIKLFTNGQPGIEFGNSGLVKELTIEPEKNLAYFFYFANNSKSPYLVPASDQFTDIKAALQAMKKDQDEQGLKKSMLLDIKENDIAIKNKTLFVSVNNEVKPRINQLTLYSFEALLLTAKEFGIEKVVVNESPVDNIGPFDLSKENKVPIAPNLRMIGE
ncbi:hypothetical protein [Bacillus rubiinfantis]|uniref:hypothetical protein n=1 Tax=Bacillus rubiinfantis TaxID=1499680 RepID=UPI0005A91978|nr:hypothetical protein [Bacillus rubiinfantis]